MGSDFSELNELVADLGSAPEETEPFLKKALEVSARNLKSGWKQRAQRSSYYPKTYAAAIDYDMYGYAGFGGGEIYAEIGPKLGATSGASAGFLDEPLSSAGVDSAPMHAGRAAVEAVEPDFVDGIEKALADGLAKALGAT